MKIIIVSVLLAVAGVSAGITAFGKLRRKKTIRGRLKAFFTKA